MGAQKRPREFDDELLLPSQTEQLANWISQVRCKKIMCRRNRKRNLRVEALLTYALNSAEVELRNKQISRISRWQQMKMQLNKDEERKFFDCMEQEKNECTDPWKNPGLFPELSSLDSFMSKLSEIKVPLQR